MQPNNSPRLTIILNPSAGRGRGAHWRQTLERSLNIAGLTWEIVETTAPGDGSRLAAEAASRGAEIVVAAGGDGTLGEVVNGLMACATRPRLGVIPLGTGNDFARCIGIPLDVAGAVDTLLHGTPRAIDVGRVTFADESSRWFINVAGCGFDALVAQRVNALRSRPGWRHVRGTPAYLCAVFQELARLRPASVKIELDAQSHEQKALLCAVANATGYGGGMRVAPDAQLDDGLFDLCVIGNAGRVEFLRAFPRVFSGTHVSHPKVTMRRAASIVIASAPPLPVLVDGDVLGTTPATFTIVACALAVLAP